VLYSSEGDNSNSKGSLIYSPDDSKKKINITNDPSSSGNKDKKFNNSNSNKSNNTMSNKSNKTVLRELINKRKKYSNQVKNKMICINLKNTNAQQSSSSKSNGTESKREETYVSLSELEDQVDNLNALQTNSKPSGINESSFLKNNMKNISSSSFSPTANVNITNITNIIKLQQTPQSMDISSQNKNQMHRDIKALHLITNKALTTKSKHNPVDSFDDERTNFKNFKNISSNKALFIDDGENMNILSNKEKVAPLTARSELNHAHSFTFTNNEVVEPRRNHVINIININNNYNFENMKTPSGTPMNSRPNYNINNYLSSAQNKQTYNTNYKRSGCETEESQKSNLSFKTQQRKIPKNTNNLKDILHSINKKDSNKKEKFIRLSNK
jgi:hypothetical protein